MGKSTDPYPPSKATPYGCPVPYAEPHQDRAWMSAGCAVLRLDIECNSGTGPRRITGTQLTRNDEVLTFIDVPIPRKALTPDEVGELAKHIASALCAAWQTREAS